MFAKEDTYAAWLMAWCRADGRCWFYITKVIFSYGHSVSLKPTKPLLHVSSLNFVQADRSNFPSLDILLKRSFFLFAVFVFLTLKTHWKIINRDKRILKLQEKENGLIQKPLLNEDNRSRSKGFINVFGWILAKHLEGKGRSLIIKEKFVFLFFLYIGRWKNSPYFKFLLNIVDQLRKICFFLFFLTLYFWKKYEFSLSMFQKKSRKKKSS